MDAMMHELRQKTWAAIEAMLGVSVKDVEVIADPTRPRAYAFRVEFGGGIYNTYELEGYADQPTTWIRRQIRAVQFTQWPPLAKSE